MCRCNQITKTGHFATESKNYTNTCNVNTLPFYKNVNRRKRGMNVSELKKLETTGYSSKLDEIAKTIQKYF